MKNKSRLKKGLIGLLIFLAVFLISDVTDWYISGMPKKALYAAVIGTICAVVGVEIIWFIQTRVSSKMNEKKYREEKHF